MAGYEHLSPLNRRKTIKSYTGGEVRGIGYRRDRHKSRVSTETTGTWYFVEWKNWLITVLTCLMRARGLRETGGSYREVGEEYS